MKRKKEKKGKTYWYVRPTHTSTRPMCLEGLKVRVFTCILYPLHNLVRLAHPDGTNLATCLKAAQPMNLII